jgi:sigma-E factor negative regulatory protein RseC
MEIIGRVIKVDGSLATVFIENTQSCDSCELAAFCRIDKEGRKIICKNNKGAQIGDIVCIDTSSKNIIKATFLNFVFPIFLLVLGATLGKKIWQIDIAGFILGMSLTVLYFFLILFIDKKIKKESHLLPEVISIKKENHE